MRSDHALPEQGLGSPRLHDLSSILNGLDCRSARVGAQLRFWVLMLAICAGSDFLFASLIAGGRPVVGSLYGAAIGGAVLLYEQGIVAPRLRERLRRLPLVPGVVGTEVAYVVMIMIGGALAGTVLKLTGVLVEPWPAAVLLQPMALFYSLLVSGTLITVNRMQELIGAAVFRNLLMGRYHVPVEEERIFLFIDLIGSTSYAQTHGDVRAQAFLGAIFAALAEPVRRCRGSIDDYVGDMALVTWPLAAGTTNARCVVCVFAFLEAIARDADWWRREFGQVPQFRAALHGGRIVTAEVGLDRHKIAYFGDVVNTTGRIEGLCRVLDAPFLVSSELFDRLATLPRGITATNLGAHAVKGRGEALAVMSLGLAAAPEIESRDQSAASIQRAVPDVATA